MGVVSETHGSRSNGERTGRYVLGFPEIDQTQVAIVGGKGANLGELSHVSGLRVPAGFCVTTDAFQRIMAEAPSIDDRIEQLSRQSPDDHETIRALSAAIRRTIEGIAVPDDLALAIRRTLAELGEEGKYAVRSSATAEDLPTASFAGQHDTYLNISGPVGILRHISQCWASLFTERAVTYRLRNGVDHRKVRMAVVVQRMVSPQAAGILFTADPVTGNRKVVSVEATFGLGEALVSGLVNADVYKVRDGEIVSMMMRQERPALTDAQVTRLAQLGRQIEARFGRPQDIEWCLADDDFHIVQSRPITTLFPIPPASDRENHVYVSSGHQQMMTDAMTPLGISVRQLTAAVQFHEAGGRLFVDVSRALATPAGRRSVLGLGKSDPLIGDALQTIVDRGFIPSVPDAAPSQAPASNAPPPLETDPAIVAELIARGQESNAKLAREIGTKSGSELIDFILADFQELKRILLEPRSFQAILAGMEPAWWLNDHLAEWIGEKNVADTLTQSAPNNITSEMGLELLHVADVIRPHPAVVAFLEHVESEDFLNELPGIEGGAEAKEAIQAWLDKYGMRCVGEIDITRPRWSERPTTLVPLILINVRSFGTGEGQRRFEQGLEAARAKEKEVLERLRSLPDGDRKAHEVKSMIDRLRTFVGYREYPKYFIVSRYFSYKPVLLKEAERLMRLNVIRETEDIFFLTLQELQDVVRTSAVDQDLIRQRKEAFRDYQGLTPPRVLTSDGEMLAGAYRRDDVPSGALVGLAVSAGTIEGRARVVFDPAKADLEPGDILITTYTDPSWTPLFVAIKGLVTEVGGLMTHGAVIAREYGLPAVVGVEHATRLIRDGQLIRVDGTNGHVETL
jgi:pyruvate,water dikinase